jgi:HK97 gp10 family phage protein
MANLKFKFDTGMQKMFSVGNKTVAKLERNLAVSYIQVAGMMVTTAQKQIKPRGSVLVPYEPFRNRTGNARRSIKNNISKSHISIIGGSATVDYFSYLEYGTQKMPPYPTLGSAVEKHHSYLDRKIEQTTCKFFNV